MALVAFVGVAGPLAVSLPARAEVPVHVGVRAPCGDDTTFFAKLADHAPSVVRRSEGPGTDEVRAEVVPEGESFVGALTVRHRDGQEGRREVRGETCEQVLSALALMGALAVEARAATVAPAEPPPAKPASAPPATVDRPAGSAPSSWIAGAEGGGASMLGVVPSIGAFVDRSFLHVAGSWGTGNAAVETGSLRFDFLLVRADVCPWRVELGLGFAVRPCGAVGGGVVLAHGRGLPDAAASTRPWVAPGAAGWLELKAADPLRLGLRLGVEVPVIRDDFSVALGAAGGPSRSVWTPPLATFTLALAAGMRFP
ncbi:MAG: hypothetical protein HOO96_10430 [Polyangiaceae bacterium]|nr:hypothetical protein [Polyangiaceae bacterium]